MKKNARRLLAIILTLCMLSAVIPTAFAAEPQRFDILGIELHLDVQGKGGGQHEAVYTATLKVGEQFAETVAVYHDRIKVLKDLRFGCELTGKLVDQMTTVTGLNVIPSGTAAEIFVQEGAPVLTGTGAGKTLTVTFRLTDDIIEDWKGMETEDVFNDLNGRRMTLTCDPVTVTDEQLKNADESTAAGIQLVSYADVYITRASGVNVTIYDGTSIHAAHGDDALLLSELDVNVDGSALRGVDHVTVTVTDGTTGSDVAGPKTQSGAGVGGKYTFELDGLPYGLCNVVVEVWFADGTSITVTEPVYIQQPQVTLDVAVPATYLNTHVTGDVPASAGGLEGAISEEEKESVELPEETDTALKVIDVVLETKSLNLNPSDEVLDDYLHGTASAIMSGINSQAASDGWELLGGGFVDFVDVIITKQVTLYTKSGTTWDETDEGDPEQIHSTNNYVTVSFPVSDRLLSTIAQGGSGLTAENILVYRRHADASGDTTRAVRKVSSAARASGECFYITHSAGGDYITIQANSFSVYAFGVSLSAVAADDESGTPGNPPSVGPGSGHVVTFDSCGGSAVPSRTVKPGEELDLSGIVPTRDGYVFTGWYTDRDLTSRVTRIKPEGGVTLYAGWQKKTADPAETGVGELLDTAHHIAYVRGVPGGLFAPGANMTRAEAAQMFYNLLLKPVQTTASFTDVPVDKWYAPAVNALASLEIIKGVGNGTFEPERSITRAEFTTIAMRFAKTNPGGVDIFPDLEKGSWYYDYVLGATTYGWIAGKDNGRFDPYGLLTRAEAVTIINRMLQRSGDQGYINSHTAELITFPDAPRSCWAYYDIEEAANAHTYARESGVESWTK